MYCRSCGEQIPDDSIFCEYCGSKMSEVRSRYGENRSVAPVIIEIRIDFSLKSTWGKEIYPKVAWVDKTSIITGKHRDTQAKWDPPHINKECLRNFVLGEINKWLAKGWELVENDIDSLFMREYDSNETTSSLLLGKINPLQSLDWTCRYIYIGARFHVRSTPHTSPSSVPNTSIVKVSARHEDPTTFYYR